MARALADGTQRFMPENLALTLGGDAGLGGSLNALVPLIMGRLQRDAAPEKTETTALPPPKGNGVDPSGTQAVA